MKLIAIFKTILTISIILALGVWVGFWVDKTIKTTGKQKIVQLTPTPTQMETAKPSSFIATQSGFLSLQEEVASLTKQITSQTSLDATIIPPTIELSLDLP